MPDKTVLEMVEERMKAAGRKSNEMFAHMMFFHSGIGTDLICEIPDCVFKQPTDPKTQAWIDERVRDVR